MTDPAYRVVRLAPGYDLGAFDCGEAWHNEWLSEHAATSVKAGVCAVYLLLEATEVRERVVGYYALNPSSVVRDAAPSRIWRRFCDCGSTLTPPNCLRPHPSNQPSRASVQTPTVWFSAAGGVKRSGQ